MEEDKRSKEIRELIKKILDYPMGRRIIYSATTEADEVSTKQRLDDMDFKINILIREVDLIIHTVFAIAEKHDDKAMKELAELLKKQSP